MFIQVLNPHIAEVWVGLCPELVLLPPFVVGEIELERRPGEVLLPDVEGAVIGVGSHEERSPSAAAPLHEGQVAGTLERTVLPVGGVGGVPTQHVEAKAVDLYVGPQASAGLRGLSEQ